MTCPSLFSGEAAKLRDRHLKMNYLSALYFMIKIYSSLPAVGVIETELRRVAGSDSPLMTYINFSIIPSEVNTKDLHINSSRLLVKFFSNISNL